MTRKSPDLRYWLIGLAIFAALIVISVLTRGDAPYGVVDHQAAGTARQVDIIQASWSEAGLTAIVTISMLIDLIFIGVYSYGSWRAGRSFRGFENRGLKAIGAVVIAAAALFCLTDYIETILQIVQMLRGEGSDWMAATAATAQPVKIASWVVTFIGVLIGLILARKAPGDT
ncbi:hypothetical protein [Erythrobacter rubeus]|uniref:Uncharacterized protein n=1 Tax=Erythrobacter rubeus TaxID=2760803 RepID=A0ABR8KTJ4_9SPHN|nr:hypothetical protein [Erythrobacter rubeus]MBD2841572.1 hypothetical protein [Erythrobacter rubeus]